MCCVQHPAANRTMQGHHFLCGLHDSGASQPAYFEGAVGDEHMPFSDDPHGSRDPERGKPLLNFYHDK